MAAWSEESGINAEVTVASDLAQQLEPGLRRRQPARPLLRLADQLAGYASNGSLEAYGDDLSNAGDFFPSLVDTFTFDDKFYCAPKDFSTLGLVINTDLWAAAGLTDADIPTTWDELATVAEKLTRATPRAWRSARSTQRVGAFMAQAGGACQRRRHRGDRRQPGEPRGARLRAGADDGRRALRTPPTSAPAGAARRSASSKAAMTIEGNWITGAMSADFPDVDYAVAELPAGPGGQARYVHATAGASPPASANQEAAVDLVEYLTCDEQQLAFAEAFGVMPSRRVGRRRSTQQDNPDSRRSSPAPTTRRARRRTRARPR